ncbi:acetyl-CoA acetyltransferase [Pseudohongiella nitratireducens]|uniref:Acetyl-CoA acetyltransferase n=1 Tax=Pseudohongiella nitratireducens TaxID=1768907 RepID=A0A916VIV2_9GAMM|nr:acetyl-CoA C-acetyltransferase [Pseudohongiella nitratireducens]MDF1623264.1 acetyl-CoA C-acetyltransferase [Pseudohongiella nitratireducens]GFZ75739.1 acetyl-CoA acetyltransferase [Pseudohongiella nitratireducens]
MSESNVTVHKKVRKVVIAGSARIPFCRSNTFYAELSNLDMLSDTLQQLSKRCNLAGKKIDDVVAGAVTTHSKDFNLTREAILSTDLSPATPGTTLQMACGTSLQAALMIAGRIASGDIDCGIAAGTDTASDAPVVFPRKFARRMIKLSQACSLKDRLKTLSGFSLKELTPKAPVNAEPRTGLSMGQHCELMAREWGITRHEQDELALQSHRKASAAYDSGFFDAQVGPYQGILSDTNIRADSSMEKLGSLRPAFDRKHGTLTAGNSTPLTDGAAAVLLCSESWAKENGLPILAYLNGGRSSAVDFVGGEGLLMAPTLAVSELLQKQGLTLQDFDVYEIHEAFAAQALCTLKAWEDPDFCRSKLGLEEPLGSIDRERMNIKGGSLAFGHPFAATGARILGGLAEILEERGKGRGLISICTAGGMGVAAVVEKP